ncbi:hypothetical protein DFH08DRAFT_823131 [Mycena albidolilacea]|uniref:Uncharacterized protein n=1 Tax=Mycena albidolilacea TaxID=1033008 RepID=A0AAD6Z7L2_9AGAR|nr:hypothetical protein DFH08DRAFT_823131 [Mycena albidolilacea]
MPRPGTAARAHGCAGLPPAKPGHISWVQGTILAFMQGHRDKYTKATELGKLSHPVKWGFEGQDVALEVNKDEDIDDLPAEAGEARSKYFNELCTVNSMDSNWGQILGSPLNTEENQLLGLYPVWQEAEYAKFRVEVMAALDNEHKATLQSHVTAVTGEIPTTPEGFQMPMPNRGSVIEMHSVHAGASNSLVPQIWPDYNPARFEAIQHSFREQPTEDRDIPVASFSGNAGHPTELAVTVTKAMQQTVHYCDRCSPTHRDSSMPELPHNSPGPSGVDISQGEQGEQGGWDEEGSDEQHQGDNKQDQDMGGEVGSNKQDQDMGGEEDEDNLGNEVAEDAMIESLGDGCDVAEVMGLELTAEVRLMEWDERLHFKHWVRFLMGDWELEQVNNMARNHAMYGEKGEKQGDQGRWNGEDARGEGAGELIFSGDKTSDKGQGGRKQWSPCADWPVPMSMPQRGPCSPSPPLPAPTPNTSLVRPKDNPSAKGPLLPITTTPNVSLVCPEDNPSAEGPLLPITTTPIPTPHYAPPTSNMSLVRPKDNLSAEGPLLPITNPTPTPNPPLMHPKAAWPSAWCEEWQQELCNAIDMFAHLHQWGGTEWVECIQCLIAFKQAQAYPAKGLVAAPGEKGGGLPKVVTVFLSNGWMWEPLMKLGTMVKQLAVELKDVAKAVRERKKKKVDKKAPEAGLMTHSKHKAAEGVGKNRKKMGEVGAEVERGSCWNNS